MSASDPPSPFSSLLMPGNLSTATASPQRNFALSPYNEVCKGGRKDLSASDQRSGKPRRVRRQHYMGHCAMGCACQACAYMRTSHLFGCPRSSRVAPLKGDAVKQSARCGSHGSLRLCRLEGTARTL